MTCATGRHKEESQTHGQAPVQAEVTETLPWLFHISNDLVSFRVPPLNTGTAYGNLGDSPRAFRLPHPVLLAALSHPHLYSPSRSTCRPESKGILFPSQAPVLAFFKAVIQKDPASPIAASLWKPGGGHR